MKKMYVIFAAVVLAVSMYAGELTIGSKDSSCKYAPVYGDQGDRLFCSQVIYTAEELSALKDRKITKLAFEQRKLSNNDWSNIQISLKEVDFKAFENTDFVSIDGATLIFSGTVAGSADVMVEFVLETPFEYHGGNLLLDSRKTEAGGGYSNTQWRGFYATEGAAYQVLSGYSSGSSMPETGVRTYARPDVTISYDGPETGIENVQNGTIQSTKIIEDGQLVIIKNGVKYNALGSILE